MKTIIVCVKPTDKNVLKSKKTISASVEYDISPYDFYALQIALNYKREYCAKVICLSMGAKKSEQLLQKCIQLGADEAILISDSSFAGSDSYATSQVLYKAIKKIGRVDFIFTGLKSLNGETGQIGLNLAALLDAYLVVNHKAMNISDIEKQRKSLNSEILLYVFSDYQFSKSVTLYDIYNMKNSNITIWDKVDIDINTNICGTKGSLTVVKGVKKMEFERKGTYIDGALNSVCDDIYSIIFGR